MTRAAPPAVGAVVLGLLGHRTGAVALAVVCLALIVVGLAAPAAAERLDAAIAKLAHGVAHGVSLALGALAWVFGVLPVWAWTRIWRRSTIDNAWVSPQSAWTIPPSAGDRDATGATRGAGRSGAPDGSHAPTSGLRRLERATLALTVVVAALGLVAVQRGLPVGIPSLNQGETADTVALDQRNAPSTAGPGPALGEAGSPQGTIGPEDLDASKWAAFQGSIDFDDLEIPKAAPRRAKEKEVDEFDGLPVDDYAHQGEPWAPRHFGDLTQLPYAPDFFLGSRIADFTSETTNVVDGVRVSYTPEDPELTVWFFGGSTTFGIGQRDDHTVPSVVARAAEADGISIRAVNFGVAGYVNWQSTERFEQALTAGMERPDLVVFYDGVNDWGLGSFRVDMGDRAGAPVTRLPLGDDERERMFDERGRPEKMPWSDERENLEIDLTADQYRRGADLARRLGKEAGVPVVHVWQPSPFAKVVNPVDEPLWKRVDFNPDWMKGSARHYRLIAERSGVEPIDLTRVLDDVDVPVYFDSSHTNELGARIVGNALYRKLRPELQQAAERR